MSLGRESRRDVTRCDGVYEHVHVHGSIMVSSRSPVTTRARRCNAGAACNAGGTRTPGRETIRTAGVAAADRSPRKVTGRKIRFGKWLSYAAAVASRGRCEPFQLSLTWGTRQPHGRRRGGGRWCARAPPAPPVQVTRSGAGSRVDAVSEPTVRVQYVPGAPTARGAAGAQGTARLRTAHTTARL